MFEQAAFATCPFRLVSGVSCRVSDQLQQVYSFVPIPGAQQHKRPRRRYEEIERMYKCGWQGCEKAYGTLNHLNAHVTMQSHGNKRTPEGMFDCLFCSSARRPFRLAHYGPLHHNRVPRLRRVSWRQQ
jgi:hypothetical protein